MMKNLFAILFLLSINLSYSQFSTSLPTTKIGGENSKWTFGGYAGFGGAFGSGGGGTSLYLSPKVGYMLAKNFEMGLAGNFTWNNSSYYSSTMGGFGPYFNFYFSRSFYMNGMFQEFFINQKNKPNNLNYNKNEAALYIGGGYMQRIGEHVYMQIGGMYNVLYNNNSAFSGGFIPNFGIVYGI